MSEHSQKKLTPKEYGSNAESLKRNNTYYSDNRQFLIQEYYKRFVIVHNGEYHSNYKSRGDAMNYCDINLPVEECIILKINENHDLFYFGNDDTHKEIMDVFFG